MALMMRMMTKIATRGKKPMYTPRLFSWSMKDRPMTYPGRRMNMEIK